MSANADLHLVPETLLKRRHDLDSLRARSAASSLTRSITRKRVSDKTRAVRIIKPETIITRARSRRNLAARFNRVSRKGMMKRASNVAVVRSKAWDGEGDAEADDDVDAGARVEGGGEERGTTTEESSGGAAAAAAPPSRERIPYRANSVGANMVFAILVRPVAHAAPRPVRRTLASLRLRRVDEGVFLPYDARTRRMLHLVETHVLYGVPSPETVSDLVRRRGYCKVDGKRVPLADNNVIERELGESLGMICVEDLVHALTSSSSDLAAMIEGGGHDDGDGGGTSFGKVAKFLWPFRLTARKSKFQRRTLDIKDGKLYGDQGEAMNGYIREML
ncbi:hypothetical protein ACHAW5_002840 [Stephanodiscus triporus]|uniref:Large ribosomal subunit protein uL30-like ferredoxin-like fold domain-containing protein n=1 Tax=Stephanodiscus triporus TaxID=2934178 RepID=A0ABD3Q5L6_9STRA